mgnify:FL=1
MVDWVRKSQDITGDVGARNRLKELEDSVFLLSQDNERLKTQLNEKKKEADLKKISDWILIEYKLIDTLFYRIIHSKI